MERGVDDVPEYPLTERVIWTDYQDPISHIERWGLVAIKEVKGSTITIGIGTPITERPSHTTNDIRVCTGRFG